MMDEIAKFWEHIDRLISGRGKIVFQAQVSGVDESARTCTVKTGGITYGDVRLYSVVKPELKGFAFIPVVGSIVLVARIGDSNELCIVQFSEVEKVIFTIAEDFTLSVTGGSVELSVPEIIINGGNLGGLLKIDDITAKLNDLVKTFNSHTHSGVITAVSGGSGAPAVGTPGSSTVPDQAAASFSKGDYEDTKIKH